MLYFAYGSNLNRADMLARCPAALPLSRARLPDHALVFRGWADVASAPDRSVTGGLWRITTACEATLDAYEDVAGGLYRRLMLAVVPEGGTGPVEALVYRMVASHAAPPEQDYLATALQGYRDFGIDGGEVVGSR